jgi:hypothetical protein
MLPPMLHGAAPSSCQSAETLATRHNKKHRARAEPPSASIPRSCWRKSATGPRRSRRWSRPRRQRLACDDDLADGSQLRRRGCLAGIPRQSVAGARASVRFRRTWPRECAAEPLPFEDAPTRTRARRCSCHDIRRPSHTPIDGRLSAKASPQARRPPRRRHRHRISIHAARRRSRAGLAALLDCGEDQASTWQNKSRPGA